VDDHVDGSGHVAGVVAVTGVSFTTFTFVAGWLRRR